MRIEFTCTTEDRLEAQKAQKAATAELVKPSKVTHLAIYVCIVAVVALIILLSNLPAPTLIAAEWPWRVETDVRLMILPAIIIPCFILWIYVVSAAFPPRTEKKSVRTSKKLDPRNARWARLRKWANRVAVVFFAVSMVVAFVTMIRERTFTFFRARDSVWLLSGMSLFGLQFALWISVAALVVWLETRHRRRNFTTWLAADPNWENVVCEFNNNGLELVRAKMRVHYTWSACRRFIETENIYVLTLAYETMEIIPKRAFAGLEESIQFLTLLTEKVGNGFIIERPGHGFPVQPLPMAGIAPPPLP